MKRINTRCGGEKDAYQSDRCRAIARNEGLDLVKNDWGSLSVFVGEAAVDLDTAVYARKEGRVEVFHDNVDIGEVGEATRE